MPQLLSLNNCSFAYDSGDFRIENVSLAVNSGRMCGIVGPNGSGKSTLLRIMAGISSPGKGRLSVKGKDVRQYSRREFAREVAFLPQNPSPSFDLTVRDVVSLGRYPHQGAFGLLTAGDRRVIDRILAETECDRLAGRLFSTLSGGERQRVLVASVLAQEPGLLLLDEPSAALDIHHKTHIFDLLWLLSRRGIAVVVVTHDLNMAGEFCDELFLLSGGSVVSSGAPSQVMQDELLSQVYDAELRIIAHPLTGKPLVNVMGKKLHGERR